MNSSLLPRSFINATSVNEERVGLQQSTWTKSYWVHNMNWTETNPVKWNKSVYRMTICSACIQVLLELLTGLPAFDDQDRDDRSLVSQQPLCLQKPRGEHIELYVR